MTAIDAMFLVGFVASIAFPIGYASIARVENRVLFIAASYGLAALVGLCLLGMAVPIGALLIFVFPQLEASGINVLWAAIPARFVASNAYLAEPILVIVGTLTIRRRYPTLFQRRHAT